MTHKHGKRTRNTTEKRKYSFWIGWPGMVFLRNKKAAVRFVAQDPARRRARYQECKRTYRKDGSRFWWNLVAIHETIGD